ncbi:putative phospholipase D [Yersinia enterocolitica]|nr:phospholipase D-like domain-containing protein [Yersinia enterocolitica]CFQ21966.1 putative phospholipase D [Yersinia enterocolitica]CNF83024.1 putative phospholipase D [Yersinia enterocolitica]CNK48815.1 putative phospholipase D [Yersinia enterocolitica]CNK79760.1 putative phospholipase D [Yersinia enterocolitica]CRY33265.1 putative phospholipase D [Yersinia enterocolitica]
MHLISSCTALRALKPVLMWQRKPIAVALIAAKNRGVKVRVVADMKANQDKYTVVNFLANQEVAVKLNHRYAIMHNKYMVVDGHNVQTGSFNYTSSAAKRNAENVILFKNAPAMRASMIVPNVYHCCTVISQTRSKPISPVTCATITNRLIKIIADEIYIKIFKREC